MKLTGVKLKKEKITLATDDWILWQDWIAWNSVEKIHPLVSKNLKTALFPQIPKRLPNHIRRKGKTCIHSRKSYMHDIQEMLNK